MLLPKRHANFATSSSHLDHVTTEVVVQLRHGALAVVAVVNTKSILITSIWWWGEDAQVDHPRGGVELGVDGLDAEVVLVAWF